MSRPRRGAAARLVDPPLTMADLDEVIASSERRGFENGVDAAERVTRLPVNDCPMCQLKADHERLEGRVRILDNSNKRPTRRWTS